MATANIYLLFDGQCEEAFGVYKNVFGGEFSAILRYGDIPRPEGMPPIAEEDMHKIENVCLPLSGGSFIMGADGLESMGMKPVTGSNFSVYVHCVDRAEAGRVFEGLSEGGTVVMPLNETHWGGWFGICTDRFGVRWLIDHTPSE